MPESLEAASLTEENNDEFHEYCTVCGIVEQDYYVEVMGLSRVAERSWVP
jgi:hypothetical protein